MSKIRNGLIVALLLQAVASTCFAGGGATTLEQDWENPPKDARLRAYWWWLNGNVTKAAITRDLEEMKAKGFGGAVIVDAGGAEQDGNARVPHGSTFFTAEWRELYKHTLREADRLGLEMSLNIQSGWNLGGPMVTADDAAKKLTWSESKITGPTNFAQALPSPQRRDNFYKDLFVVAYKTSRAANAKPRPLQNFEEKAMYRTMNFSAPDTKPLFGEFPAESGEEDTHAVEVIDLTPKMGADGVLKWDVPAGDWVVLRFGCTIGDHSRVSTSSDGWTGFALDVLDAGAFQRYWYAVVEPLIADAGPMAGKTLKYLHTDSWEVEAVNWTPTLREEFRKRRGYDLLPYLPVLAGKIVDGRSISDRFLADFRRTLGDLAIDHHYRIFRDNAHKHGLEIHPESGGPHASPIDAQQCLGWDDAPMSEFWAWSWRHRVGDENRFFMKQPASAAHTYGHKLVLGEGFTTIGPHWQETIWDNLKPAFDKALCEGLNLLVWHAVVCSPESAGMPGQQYFAGTHFNPNTTWWSRSDGFLAYINRCQAMLQRGKFVADVLYYYGDHAPNFAQLKKSDPAKVLPGYDYDVITEEALLRRLTVKDGRLTLPDGMSYRVLVLPERNIISLPVLEKLKGLVTAGATIIGPKPTEASGLKDYPKCDVRVAEIAKALWGDDDKATLPSDRFRPVGAATKGRSMGKGRVVWGVTARDLLQNEDVMTDFLAWVPESFDRYLNLPLENTNPPANVIRFGIRSPQGMQQGTLPAGLEYIHRSDNGTEIYFISNPSNQVAKVMCAFRVGRKAMEIWDPVTGKQRSAAWSESPNDIATTVLEFEPCGSLFVIFRNQAPTNSAKLASNLRAFTQRQELTGSWQVKFDTNWAGPAEAKFDELVSWTKRDEPGIKYYSGTATYSKTFDLANAATSGKKLWLDLGNLRELAEVRLNGKKLGVVWTPPFRVDITDAVKASGNQLEVDVVNFWPNRIIGDQMLPADQRLTKTNVRKLTRDTALMESGLMGPVRVMSEE